MNIFDRPLYHASSISGIQEFETSTHCNGELATPSEAIWCCTRIEGAATHIRYTLKGRKKLQDKNNTGFIYELSCFDSAVVIDAQQRFLPPNVFKSLKGMFSFSKRWFLRRDRWYCYIHNLAERYEGKTSEGVFRVCKSLGIDVLLNPLTDELGRSWDEPCYGLSAAVLNPKVLQIRKEYRFSDCERVPVETNR